MKLWETNFICKVQNEAVLKALFRVPGNELSFQKAVEIAVEIESTAAVAKETAYSENSERSVQNVQSGGNREKNNSSPQRSQEGHSTNFSHDSQIQHATDAEIEDIGPMLARLSMWYVTSVGSRGIWQKSASRNTTPISREGQNLLIVQEISVNQGASA